MNRTILITLLFLLIPASVFAQSIDRAFQKEFVYLKAQKNAMQSRLTDLEKKTARDEGAASATVNAKQNELTGLADRREQLELQLSSADDSIARSDDAGELLAGMFEQAKAGGIEIPVTATPTATDVSKLFAASVEQIAAGGTIRTEPGTFFAQDGRQVTGDIVRVGEVAAFGKSGEVSGPLMPAGDGRLKVMPNADSTSANQIVTDGAFTGGFAAFLYENADKAIELKKEKTIGDLLEAGGVIGWVIVALGFLALLLVVARLVILFRASGTLESSMPALRKAVSSGKYDDAKKLLADVRGMSADVARSIVGAQSQGIVVADAAEASLTVQGLRIDRFATLLIVIASVAPLLGLLGTVTGMIATFDIITEFGTGDPKMLSGGISEALITTQLGLVVAIPALILGNVLNAKANEIRSEAEYTALMLMSVGEDPNLEPDLQLVGAAS